jgi:hypothetical protein
MAADAKFQLDDRVSVAERRIDIAVTLAQNIASVLWPIENSPGSAFGDSSGEAPQSPW